MESVQNSPLYNIIQTLENDVSEKLIFMESLQFPLELGGLVFSSSCCST